MDFELLKIASVDSSNSRDFKYVFEDAKYNTLGGSIQEIADALGDPTRGRNDVLGVTDSTRTSYINGIISSGLDKITDEKIHEILDNPVELAKVMDHFERNQECKKVEYYGEAAIKYPNPESDKEKIINHYLALQIEIGGIKIDEYIDRITNALFVTTSYIKDVLKSFNHTWDLSFLDDNPVYINGKNKSFQSAKYGIFVNLIDGETQDLLNGGLLDITKERNDESLVKNCKRLDKPEVKKVKKTNNTGKDAFTGGFEIPFGLTSAPIKTLIGLTYHGISGFIFAMGHEIGHSFSPQQDFPNFDTDAKVYINTYMRSDILKPFYQEANTDKSSTNKNKGGKINKLDDISLKAIWCEHACDLMGVLCVEAYIRKLPSLDEKLKAIRAAMVSAHECNIISALHPPQSMTRNLLLISKYIQDTIMGAGKSIKNLATMSGGRKKKRSSKTKKHRRARKSTRRNRQY